MILIADGGSTKTDWCMLTPGKPSLIEFSTDGFNPYFADSDFIRDSLKKNLPAEINTKDIQFIYFYGSGCFEDKVVVIEKALLPIFPNARILVYLDLFGAARALLGDQPGFVSILGTGTNTCIYNGDRITLNIDSLGYILGDEGSGCYIGKRLLGDFIRGYMPENIYQAFLSMYKTSKEEIFDRLYSQPFGNRYCAGFASFLLEKGELSPGYKEELVKSAFQDLFENLVIHYPGYQDYSFNCVGSIGFYFKDYLVEMAERYKMKPGKFLKTPMAGLVEYHNS